MRASQSSYARSQSESTIMPVVMLSTWRSVTADRSSAGSDAHQGRCARTGSSSDTPCSWKHAISAVAAGHLLPLARPSTVSGVIR